MLLGHLLYAHVCSNDDEAVVWELRSKAVHSRLQILLVATHIQQMDYLRGVLNNIWPNLVLFGCVSQFGYKLFTVGFEAHDFVGDGTRPSV